MALITGANGLGKELYDNAGMQAILEAGGFTSQQIIDFKSKIVTFADTILTHFRVNADILTMEKPTGVYSSGSNITTYTPSRNFKANTALVFNSSTFLNPFITPTPPITFNPPTTFILPGNTTASIITVVYTPTDF